MIRHAVLALLLFFLPLFIAPPGHAFPARVVAVNAGATITIESVTGGAREKVLLYGIDCPEPAQPYGEVARDFISAFALFKGVDVHLTQQNRDRDGRLVAIVDLPGVGSLQELLLGAGLAWVHPQLCQDCDGWKKMQASAKLQGIGLWSDKNPVPPWEWRTR